VRIPAPLRRAGASTSAPANASAPARSARPSGAASTAWRGAQVNAPFACRKRSVYAVELRTRTIAEERNVVSEEVGAPLLVARTAVQDPELHRPAHAGPGLGAGRVWAHVEVANVVVDAIVDAIARATVADVSAAGRTGRSRFPSAR